MADYSNYLLVSDYDHTLTDHTGHIPQENLDAIAYFMEHGGAFTVNTGRSLPASKGLFRGIPMNAPFLFCNGAGCYDLNTNELFFCHSLPDNCLDLVRKCVDTFTDIRLEIHTLEQHYAFHEDPRTDAALRRLNIPFSYVSDWTEIVLPGVKFAIYSIHGDAATLDPNSQRGAYFRHIAQTISDWGTPEYTVTLSMPGLVEVQVAGTSKGLAARELAEELGRKILVAVGDAPNDLSMLQEADLPFYVSDGDPRMLPYNFPQCAPSYEGAIADVIKKL